MRHIHNLCNKWMFRSSQPNMFRKKFRTLKSCQCRSIYVYGFAACQLVQLEGSISLNLLVGQHGTRLPLVYGIRDNNGGTLISNTYYPSNNYPQYYEDTENGSGSSLYQLNQGTASYTLGGGAIRIGVRSSNLTIRAWLRQA